MIVIFKDKKPTVGTDVFVEKSAQVIGDVRLAKNANIWFNAVLRGDINYIEIGERSNIQDCCVVHVNVDAPVIVGADVTVGHGAILHGCKIEDVCLIGMGATILDGAVVGKGSIVAAGALVLENQIIPERNWQGSFINARRRS